MVKIFVLRMRSATYYNSVIPGKYGKLIQSGYKIPTSSDVTSNEYADSK